MQQTAQNIIMSERSCLSFKVLFYLATERTNKIKEYIIINNQDSKECVRL
jgi:hypothetical protein